MAIILNIETATPTLSVALSKDGKNIASKTMHQQNVHAELITVFIEEVITKAKVNIFDLDAVSVSKGPGSYTGLRIGVSAAKGICYAQDIPLIAIDTLEALAYGISLKMDKSDENAIICPQIDARRMEVYDALYGSNGQLVRDVEATIVDASTYLKYLEKQKVCFGGTGTEKCKDVITHINAVFIDNLNPSAEYMAILAEKKYQAKAFENTAYFEPFYLKNFVAAKSKVKGLYD